MIRPLALLPALLPALLAAYMIVAPVQAAPAKKPAAPAAVAHDWTRTVVATAQGGVRIGNPVAKVALIEYGSRTCPHCAHFQAEGVPALKAKYVASGMVSYEFRDFPVHDALDLAPILLGRCGGTARFFALLDAMMAQQDALIGRTAQIPAADQARLAKASPNAVAAYLAQFYGYLDVATHNGIPIDRARACLADHAALDAIVARANAAERDFKVAGTPTFLINGKPAAASDWAGLEPLLRGAGAE